MSTHNRPAPSRSHLSWLAAGLMALTGGAWAEAVSAPVAEQQLRAGAQAWDVRGGGAGPVLPGATALDAQACLHWLRTGDVEALSRAVSGAGLNLSRTLLIYGEAGDVRAQALHEVLGRVATGRVLWLVGGIDEWQMSGRATVEAPSTRLPVPQRLVAREGEDTAARMAAASLRDPATGRPQQLAAR
jgi:3-mercaptopyruvate sulfurtransferase SseA